MRKFSMILCSLIIVVMLSASIGFAATTKGNLKLALSEPVIDLASSPYYALTMTFKSIVESQSGGRFTVQLFPNKQMGDLSDLLTQCQRGVIEFTTCQNASNLAAIFPEAGLLEMPYAFSSTFVSRILLDGPYGQDLSNRMAAESGVRPLCWLPSALRSFGNNTKPIHSPDDMKGMKIRVMPAPMMVDMVKSLGAQPTPIAWAELYTALQTGVVEGHEQPPYLLHAAKLDEVTKFYSLDNHMLNVMALSVNEKFFQSLTPEDQSMFRNAARQAQLAFLGNIQAREADDYIILDKNGVKINAITPENLIKFKELAQPAAIKSFEGNLGKEPVEKFLKAITVAEAEANK